MSSIEENNYYTLIGRYIELAKANDVPYDEWSNNLTLHTKQLDKKIKELTRSGNGRLRQELDN